MWWFVLVACGETEPTPTDTGGLTGGCELAASHQSCPSCTDGPTTCTFGDQVATAGSCGDCQARALLYAQLCTAGGDETAAEIVAGTVCESFTCEPRYTCDCTPVCGPSNEPVTCGESCTGELPACEWSGQSCAIATGY